MCQRLNTGESNNFYFGICVGPLSKLSSRSGGIRWGVRSSPCAVYLLQYSAVSGDLHLQYLSGPLP